MKIQSLFMVSLFMGLAIRAGLFPSPFQMQMAEIIVLASAAMLLFICELSGTFRRIAALERFIQLSARQEANSATRISPVAHVGQCEETADILRHHLDMIIGERHPETSREHHDNVRDLVARHLAAYGWKVRLEEFRGSYGPAHNVIAEKRGEGDDPGILIVGAHYDTVRGTPGADDNGIAVAGIMRLGELLGHGRFSKTVRLVAWDLEEQQPLSRGLLGSRQMARCIARTGERIDGVICLEMIGVCSQLPGSQTVMPGLRLFAPELWRHLQDNQFRGNFIATLGNSNSQHLSSEFANSADELGLPSSSLTVRGFLKLLRDLRRSDHSPFWDQGIPAIMVTDTSNFRSPFYHTALDLPSTIDFDFASKVVEATAKVIGRLAQVVAEETSAKSDAVPTAVNPHAMSGVQRYRVTVADFCVDSHASGV